MSFDSERSNEDSPEIIEESHPEAAEALRALQMYREGPQHEAYEEGGYANDAYAEEQVEACADGGGFENEVLRNYGSESDPSQDESQLDSSEADTAQKLHSNTAPEPQPNLELAEKNSTGGTFQNREISQNGPRQDVQEAPRFDECGHPGEHKTDALMAESLRLMERDLRELESAHRQTQRQLHQAQLQADSARAAQQRQATLAAMDAQELQRLRNSSLREKSELVSRIAEYRASADAAKADAEAKSRAFAALRERFNAQSAALAEVRAQLVELQKSSAVAETQAAQAKRQEERAQKQIEQLRDELNTALDEAAQFRAELDLQTNVLVDVRAEARREALDALAEDVGSTHDDEGVWRKQYVALRLHMDQVAAEFEQREPEILALQTAYEQAEERLLAADAAVLGERKHKDELARNLRRAERKSADLQVQQQLSESTLSDLRRQLLVLLTEKLIGTSRISPDEEDELVRLREEVAREDSHAAAPQDADKPVMGQVVITERLLLFKDVAELQFQNEALLRACRELAAQLDPTGDATAAALAAAQHNASEEIMAASEALEALQLKYRKLREEHETAVDNEHKATSELRGNLNKIAALKEQVRDLQHQLLAAKRRFTESAPPESEAPQDTEPEKLLRIQLSHAEEKLRDLQLEFAQLRDDHKSLAGQFASAQLALGRAEERGAGAASRAAELEASLANAQHELSLLAQEKKLWTDREHELLTRIASIQTDLESAEKTAEKGQDAQDELQSRLLDQITKIEALVASNGLPSQGNAANEFAGLKIKAEQAELRAEKLASQLKALGLELASSRAEHNAQLQALKDSKEALEAELRAQIQSLQLNLAREKKEAERQAQRAMARDEELVEQVNDLEDKLTEARLKVDELEHSTPEIRAELTKELTQKLRDDLTHELTGDLTQQIRERVELEVRDDLTQKIRKEFASIIREEVSQDGDCHEKIPARDVEEIESELRKKLRPEIEAALRAEFAPAILAEAQLQDSADNPNLDMALDQAEQPNDVTALRARLAALAPSETLESFEKALLRFEQQRVKEAFKIKLAEVRTKAQIHGEEVATKRAEIRTKLQNQKVLKLEQSNKELQAQVDDLRSKVRRLKGGINTDDGKPDSSSFQQWLGQDQPAGQNSSFPGSIIQGEQSFAQWPTLAPNVNPFSPSNSFFGSAFGDTAKRPGSFEDTEAKKRKEE